MQENARKMRTRITPNTDTFYAVNYMESKHSNNITGFRKPHGTPQPLKIMLEKWKYVLDEGEYVCVLFMDLSKAFDIIDHYLLFAKLTAYGFSNNALNLICSDLKKQEAKDTNQ